MQKKASLNLSIEAIVILVIAISLLGLGLGFTKGMFGQLKQQLVVPAPEIPATSEDPVVLPTGGELQIKAAKDAVFTVNFFNNGQSSTFMPDIVCDSAITVRVASQDVEAQTYKGFQIIITANSFGEDTLGYNICTIQFTDENTGTVVQSKQIIINAE
jgi:hypothetical protein